MFVRATDRIEPYQRAIVKAHLASAGIDLEENRIRLDVSDEELESRRKLWRAAAPVQGHSLLARYAQAVSSAREGATVNTY